MEAEVKPPSFITELNAACEKVVASGAWKNVEVVGFDPSFGKDFSVFVRGYMKDGKMHLVSSHRIEAPPA